MVLRTLKRTLLCPLWWRARHTGQRTFLNGGLYITIDSSKLIIKSLITTANLNKSTLHNRITINTTSSAHLSESSFGYISGFGPCSGATRHKLLTRLANLRRVRSPGDQPRHPVLWYGSAITNTTKKRTKIALVLHNSMYIIQFVRHTAIFYNCQSLPLRFPTMEKSSGNSGARRTCAVVHTCPPPEVKAAAATAATTTIVLTESDRGQAITGLASSLESRIVCLLLCRNHRFFRTSVASVRKVENFLHQRLNALRIHLE